MNADFQDWFIHGENIVGNLEDLATRVTVSFDNKKANRALGMPIHSRKIFHSKPQPLYTAKNAGREALLS
ncbi:MAG: hypothetical protein ACKO4S_11515 [Snowella sp.]